MVDLLKPWRNASNCIGGEIRCADRRSDFSSLSFAFTPWSLQHLTECCGALCTSTTVLTAPFLISIRSRKGAHNGTQCCCECLREAYFLIAPYLRRVSPSWRRRCDKFNPSVRKVDGFLFLPGLYVQGTMAVDKNLQLHRLSGVTALTHTHTYTDTHTQSALTEPVRSSRHLQVNWAPQAVTSWVTMATLTPPQSGSELTCLTTYISKQTLLAPCVIKRAEAHTFP